MSAASGRSSSAVWRPFQSISAGRDEVAVVLMKAVGSVANSKGLLACTKSGEIRATQSCSCYMHSYMHWVGMLLHRRRCHGSSLGSRPFCWQHVLQQHLAKLGRSLMYRGWRGPASDAPSMLDISSSHSATSWTPLPVLLTDRPGRLIIVCLTPEARLGPPRLGSWQQTSPGTEASQPPLAVGTALTALSLCPAHRRQRRTLGYCTTQVCCFTLLAADSMAHKQASCAAARKTAAPSTRKATDPAHHASCSAD